MNVKLTPAQGRALLAIADAGTAIQCDPWPRADVLRRLRDANLTTTADHNAALTGDGVKVVEALRSRPAKTPRRPAVPAADGPAGGGRSLVGVMPPSAPHGAAEALNAALASLPGDAAVVQFLSWLADHEGSSFLATVKDAAVVAAREGRTYAQTAAHLGLSVTAVNKAVSRHNRRAGELDN